MVGKSLLFIGSMVVALGIHSTNASDLDGVLPLIKEAATAAHETLDPRTNCASEEASLCQKNYSELFAKPEVHVTVGFGYLDSRPRLTINTQDEVDQFIGQITFECPAPNGLSNLCGFSKSPGDPEIYFKMVKGPDGANHKFEIRVVNPVIGTDDGLLRKDPAQLRQSAKARDEFLGALKTDDIVLYYGHSRNGGGPDFFPPHLNEKGAPDFNWYTKPYCAKDAASDAPWRDPAIFCKGTKLLPPRRPGISEAVNALESSGHQPKLIGLLSCGSDRFFGDALEGVSPRSAKLYSSDTASTGDLANTRDYLLDGLIGQKCTAGFYHTPDPPKGSDRVAAPVVLKGWGVGR